MSQLKRLVFVLVLSNIGLGLFSFYLLRRADHIYSELIGRAVPVLSDLQTATATAVRAMRGVSVGLLGDNAVKPEEVVEEVRAGFTTDENTQRQLLTERWPEDVPVEREEFKAAGEDFTRNGRQVISRFIAGDIREATQLRDEKLRPAFERYISAATKASDRIEDEILRMNTSLSARMENMSTVVLGIASWPVVLLVALLLLTAIFLLVLVVLFRGRELSDMP